MADDETNSSNYTSIERPYDPFLNRSPLSNISDKPNGNVETQPVKTDGAMSDVWISNFIRSKNWSPKTSGFYINGITGYAEFSNVFMSGNVTAKTGNIGGFTITDTSLSATDGVNTTIISSGPIAFSAGQTGSPSVTITQAGAINAISGSISGSFTVGGRLADTIGGALNASGDLINNVVNAQFDTSTSMILSNFTFGNSGAIKMASTANDGLWISPGGILGKQGGVTTFSVDTAGNASFRGQVVITGGSGYNNMSDKPTLGALSSLNSVGASNCNTTIINGGYIVTGLITADNIQAGTLTGRTIQTAFSGSRVVLDSTNYMRFYSGSYLRMHLDTTKQSFYDENGSLNGSIYGTFTPGQAGLAIAGDYLYLTPETHVLNNFTAGTTQINGNFTVANGYGMTLNGSTIYNWPSGGGGQTPWNSNINANGYSLTNASGVSASSITLGNITKYSWPTTDLTFYARTFGNYIYSYSGNYIFLGTSKTAIVPTSRGYNALYSNESPNVWFMDFCDDLNQIDPMFLEVTSAPYHFIKCEGGGYQVWGIRRGYERTRFESKTEDDFKANERFLNLNKVDR